TPQEPLGKSLQLPKTCRQRIEEMASVEVNPSIWRRGSLNVATTNTPIQPSYDVIVVGGGIAGILSAYFLSQSRQSVCLLEADSFFGGVTGHTTGKLTSQH